MSQTITVPVADDPIALWAYVHAVLDSDRKPKDRTPQHRLNRLTREFVGDCPNVDASTFQIRLEKWSTEDFSKVRRHHTREKPRGFDGAVFVVILKGERLLIDGGNRVNVWLRDGDTEIHDVVVIEHQPRKS